MCATENSSREETALPRKKITLDWNEGKNEVGDDFTQFKGVHHILPFFSFLKPIEMFLGYPVHVSMPLHQGIKENDFQKPLVIFHDQFKTN